MKNQRFLKRSKKFALGIALALGCNVLSMGMMSNAEAAVLDTQITGGTVTLTEDTTIDTFAPVDSTLYGGIQNVYSGGSTITLEGYKQELNIITGGKTGNNRLTIFKAAHIVF